ncbi:hypothetical protein GCM10009535_36070 [Streptomyces thermocarboxydovorans]|uniref:Uncharacterized protein n=1 Tax=Streptomyces thermocarboxydovorans TaxID=59298 RepID=A0ABN1HJB3_9ACTN
MSLAPQAAVVLVELLLVEDEEEDEPDPESEDDEELDDFEAGELLEEVLRLSLR